MTAFIVIVVFTVLFGVGFLLVATASDDTKGGDHL